MIHSFSSHSIHCLWASSITSDQGMGFNPACNKGLTGLWSSERWDCIGIWRLNACFTRQGESNAEFLLKNLFFWFLKWLLKQCQSAQNWNRHTLLDNFILTPFQLYSFLKISIACGLYFLLALHYVIYACNWDTYKTEVINCNFYVEKKLTPPFLYNFLVF